MAWNSLPHSIPALFTLAHGMHDGLVSLQDAILVKQNRANVFLDVLDATRAAHAAHEAARVTKYACTAASTIADSNAKGFIATARDVLKRVFGMNWTPKWEGTGFANGSLAIPETVEKRQETARKLGEFFVAHPTLENAPLGVTAVRAQEIFAALDAARAAVRAALADTTAKRAARDLNVDALRAQMRGLIAELHQLLADDDGRWATFGLCLPGGPNRPDIPDGLVLHAGPAGSGTVYIDWDNAPRAERYRVWKQVAGVDSDFVAAVTVTDSDATITGLPAGAAIAIRVTAANETGETKPCEAVAVTLS
jgi:hypothetical protein